MHKAESIGHVESLVSPCPMPFAILFDFEDHATEQPHKLLHVLELKHGDGNCGVHLDPLPLQGADAGCRS